MGAVFSIIGSVLVGIGKSLLTEKFARWAFFRLADILVKKTDTPEDDKWLEKIKEMSGSEE